MQSHHAPQKMRMCIIYKKSFFRLSITTFDEYSAIEVFDIKTSKRVGTFESASVTTGVYSLEESITEYKVICHYEAAGLFKFDAHILDEINVFSYAPDTNTYNVIYDDSIDFTKLEDMVYIALLPSNIICEPRQMI